MSKAKGGIDYTPRLSGESKKFALQGSQAQKTVLNKTSANTSSLNLPTAVPRSSTGSYNPFLYAYQREYKDIQGQQQQSQSLQTQQSNNGNNSEQQEQIGVSVQENQSENRIIPDSRNEQGPVDGTNGGVNANGKSEVFIQNYRVSNTYRPIQTQHLALQASQQQNQAPVQNDKAVENQKKSLPSSSSKIKLNKSSKIEAPLKPIFKDFSQPTKTQQQLQVQQQQQQAQQFQAGNISLAQTASSNAAGNKQNSNSTHVSTNPTTQVSGIASSSNLFQKYQSNSNQQQTAISEQNIFQPAQSQLSQPQQIANNNQNIPGQPLRFVSAHSSHSQRMLSPKTEPSEHLHNFTGQQFYSTKLPQQPQQNSPHKYKENSSINNNKQPQTNNSLPFSIPGDSNNSNSAVGANSKYNQPHSNNLNGLGIGRKSQTPKRSPNSISIQQSLNNVNSGLGINIGNNNIGANIMTTSATIASSTSNTNNNFYPQGLISTGNNSLTVSGNFNNFPATMMHNNSVNTTSNVPISSIQPLLTHNNNCVNSTTSLINPNNNSIINNNSTIYSNNRLSPMRKNISPDQLLSPPPLACINLLPTTNQTPSNNNNNSSTNNTCSPIKHKKSISDVNNQIEIQQLAMQSQPKEQQSQDMFLIRDQDTGQVYDIRQIDKIDSFSKTNNQEYFDKLKRRHKNAWQGWWNSKKENNIKMIQSVKQNEFHIVEQLLQHERADLRADTDFKDQNQWACIHYAAFNNNSSILNLLISHDANLSLLNNFDQTALMIGAEKGYSEIVDICIKAGSDINRQDINLNTALHFACKSGNAETVGILLKCKDINKNLTNVENKLPYQCTQLDSIISLFNVQNQDYKSQQQQYLNYNSGSNSSSNIQPIQNNANSYQQYMSNNNKNELQRLPEEDEEEDNKQEEDNNMKQQQQQNNANYRTVPRNSNYEQILNHSVLSGFYGQKLTLSTNYGQAQKTQQPQLPQLSEQQSSSNLVPPSPQLYQSEKQQQQQQSQQQYQSQQSYISPYQQTPPKQQIQQQGYSQLPSQQQSSHQPLVQLFKQQLNIQQSGQGSTDIQTLDISQQQQQYQQQSIQSQQQSSQQGSFNQQQQHLSSGNSMISNNRSSNCRSGAEGSPPNGQGMRQSISSQGSSSVNSQNQLSDSQLGAFGSSAFYQQSQQQQPAVQQQLPWRVVIHDFPNESVLKMFDPQSNVNKTNNSNPNGSDLSNNNTQNSVYTFSSNNNNNNNNADSTYYNSNNSNNNQVSQQQQQAQQQQQQNNGYGRGSATPNNINTLVSTNETIINSSSPTQKHHKVHSQDILPSSAAQLLQRKHPSHSTQISSGSSQNQQQQSQQQLQQQQQQQQMQQQQQEDMMKQNERVGPEHFRIVNLIGRGSFGEVYLVEKKGSSQEGHFAMKMLHKSKVLGQNLTKYAMTERNVLSIMCHPFIVKLMYAFQTSKDLFLIMEYMPGGDLSHALQRDKRFSESRARIYLVEIMLAIRHLHKHDIIYRDLKPENIVIDSEGHAMLTDFGLSKDGIYDHYSTHSFCGSLAYLAPEMLKRSGHGKAVDYYHLGVLLYEMLTGTPPFFSDTKEEICHNIEFQEIRFPSHVTDNARNLISKLLVKNPNKRLGAGKNDFEEMKKQPFFQGINWSQALARKLKPPAPYIKPVVDSKSNSTPNFMMTMTPLGMTTDNHINGWSFFVDPTQKSNNTNNINNGTMKF